MTTPTGDDHLHELELIVREELIVVESSPLEEESDDAPTVEWELDVDAQRYDASLRTLLGAIDATEDDGPVNALKPAD
jgi:hypothetical protein